MSDVSNTKKSIRVSIAGRPNVGKSTLLNRILGQKLVITSAKPQTTQDNILGILTENEIQIVLCDHPGIFLKEGKVKNRNILKAAWSGLDDSELILFLSDGTKHLLSDDLDLLQHVINKGIPVFYVINKSDKMNIDQKFKKLTEVKDIAGIKEFFTISAEYGKGCDILLKEIKKLASVPYWYYNNNEITDKSNEFLAKEFIRERLFRFLGDELPYETIVEIDSFSEKNGIIEISSMIIVNKIGHKKIILGEDGNVLNKIIKFGAIEMEKLFDSKIKLNIFIKVRPS